MRHDTDVAIEGGEILQSLEEEASVRSMSWTGGIIVVADSMMDFLLPPAVRERTPSYHQKSHGNPLPWHDHVGGNGVDGGSLPW